MSKMKSFLYFGFLLVSVAAKNEEVEGWSSYYVLPYDHDELVLFNDLVDKYNVDVYSQPYVKREGLVLLEPSIQNKFIEALDDLKIRYRLHTKDLKAHLDLEEKIFQENFNAPPSRIGGRLPYNQYQNVATINRYMDEMAARFPRVATVVTRRSHEGNAIKYMRVSTTNFADARKPIIFIDGGIHGREWLSIPPVTYVINRLVENVTDPDLLNRFDWILMPIVNPDGYNHSQVVFAPWRKNRSTTGDAWSRLCPGTDIDSNFDIAWNSVGAEFDRCSNFFPGVRAFSEIESGLIREILRQNPRILMYISFSSFGSMIMYPWAFDGSLSPFALTQHAVAIRMAEAIDAVKLPNFHSYRVGNAALVRMRRMAGTSIDYAHRAGVPLTFTIELPGLFGGYFMNPIFIEQVVIETWEGIRAGVRRAAQLI